MVVVPTRQSGRRLREAIAGHAATKGQAAFAPRVLTPAVRQKAQELLQAGRGRNEVARELGLKSDTLRKAIRAGRIVEPNKKK